jgi:hypothetical protein
VGREMEQHRRRTSLLPLSGSLILLGCVAAGVPDAVQTLSVKEFAKAPESYRGQTLRICGERLEKLDTDPPVWSLYTPRAAGYHPAEVKVLPCSDKRPGSASSKCIAGRVARHNGSLELRRPEEIIVQSAGGTSPWYLHAQCFANR